MKDKGMPEFFWQDGYGIFSVSASKVETVKRYFLNQKAHHQTKYFEDELREFLKQYNSLVRHFLDSHTNVPEKCFWQNHSIFYH